MPTSKIVSLIGKTEVVEANFKGSLIEMFRKGAYINANQIAAIYSKRLDNWMRLESTKELLEEFRNTPAYRYLKPIKTFKGNPNGWNPTNEPIPSDLREYSTNEGTWMHPDIALIFAQWCSPTLALWVARQINHLLQYGEVNLDYQEWTAEQHQLGSDRNIEDKESTYTRW
jgi:hypothetical protein